MEQGQERWRDCPEMPPDFIPESPRRKRFWAVSPNAFWRDIACRGNFHFRSHFPPTFLSSPDIEDANQLFKPSHQQR